jgi:single-stranded-DNA-specific exonuclease
LAQGADLVLTCDTGIAAHDAITYAAERGVDTIVTDHHDLPPSLPLARALVNPKRLPSGHPLATLPGVGVAYKVAEALYARTGRPHDVEQHLDLVALGIVADLAVLTGDTRFLLQRGLERLRRTERLGLQVMLEMAGLFPGGLSEEHVAFELAPRLNALGRLGNANMAVEFLTTTDNGRARLLATQLEGLNEKRKLLTDQVFQGALAQLERYPDRLRDAVLVLDHPSWPAGVIGIVASRLVERLNRPVILVATPPGEIGRGSARSVEGCNISEAIASHADLLISSGGHPMAAGLSIEPERIPAFRRALSSTVTAMLGEQPPRATLQIDAYVSLADINPDLVADLERLAPFGPGNPSPVLASRSIVLQSHRVVGRHRNHVQMVVTNEQGLKQRVIWWQGAGLPLPEGPFDLAYAVRARTYQGQHHVQLEWIDARPQREADVTVQAEAIPATIDLRGIADPWADLAQLRAETEVQVWCEAQARLELQGQDRTQLAAAPALAIWTTPPGRQELLDAVRRVSPERVFVFGLDPQTEDLRGFLERLAGLVKHNLEAGQGQISTASLAAATAQREDTVRAGVRWLAAQGHLRILGEANDMLQLAAGGSKSDDASRLLKAVKEHLDETAAYRRYFAQADVQNLLK